MVVRQRPPSAAPVLPVVRGSWEEGASFLFFFSQHRPGRHGVALGPIVVVTASQLSFS